MKKSKTGEVLAVVKGRDYFDLLWYLDRGVVPNLSCLDHNNMADLKEDLIKMVGQADARSIKSDLEPLIADAKFVDNFSKNFKEILKMKIGERK